MKVEVDFPSSETSGRAAGTWCSRSACPPTWVGIPMPTGPSTWCYRLALCTAHHVRAFLAERGLPIEDAGLVVQAERSPDSHLLESVSLELRVPKELPEKYNDAIMRAAEQCAVKQQLGCKPECVMSVVRV